jgi:hypothetical protein
MVMRMGLTVVALVVGMATPAVAAVDHTPPSVPQNFREIGVFAGRQVLGWDASTDDSGSVNHYSVQVDGAQAYRPRVTTVRIDDLVQFCHMYPGHTYRVAVQAVDAAGNHSASSASLQVTVF